METVEKLESFVALRQLALNLRWSWNHASDAIWEEIDADAWDTTRNPWGILQTVSRKRLHQLLHDKIFLAKLDKVIENEKQAEAALS